MVHSANGHRTRKGGNSGAPPDLDTTAPALHSTNAAATAGRTGPAAANRPSVLARTQVGGGSTGRRLPLRGRGHAAARGPALRAVGRPFAASPVRPPPTTVPS